MPDLVAAPREFLNFGGGVNSTAMLILMRQEGWDGEAVFADHHGDWPETYEYLDVLAAAGYAITRLDVGDIYEAHWRRGGIPHRQYRSCTDHFKRRPLNKYMGAGYRVAIGFAADEAHRAQNGQDAEGKERFFPLIERGYTREDCKFIIERAGLPVPRKSGCYFCPFARKAEIKELVLVHPELFDKAVALEDRARAKNPKRILWRIPARDLIECDQPDLFGGEKPCACGT
jgi:3'-phosphoadenosine 5'-phosphosulfate sulfotransferase (PAPS reductase)/FAD synthetase